MSNKINIQSLSSIMEKYINLTNEIKNLDKKSRDLKKEKSTIEEQIISVIEEKKLTKKEFIKGNVKISYELNEKKDSINQKFLKNALSQYFNNTYYGRLSPERCERKANELFEYILSLRKTKSCSSLKQLPI